MRRSIAVGLLLSAFGGGVAFAQDYAVQSWCPMAQVVAVGKGRTADEAKNAAYYACVGKGGQSSCCSQYTQQLSPARSLRPGERQATAAELAGSFVGKHFITPDGGHRYYAPGGAYTIALANGTSFTGNYTIGDGYICVDVTGRGFRCDQIMVSSEGYALVNRADEHYALKLAP